MKIIKIVCVAFALLTLPACDALKENLGNLDLGNAPLTQEEVVRGLKNALTVGTDSAVGRLTATDGFLRDAAVKILLPPEAQNIMNKVSKIPGGQELVDKVITSINRSAEDAAKTASPIFVDAIKKMTIQDAFGILRGADNAATEYLRTNTYSQLQTAFRPIITTSLDKKIVFNTSASSLYQDLVNAYNLASLGGSLFPKITQNNLTDYVTGKALDGVFMKITNEEKLIRQDPFHRVTSILQKVFGKK